MSFWENLSGGTKAFVIIGAVLMVIVLAIRASGPSEDEPVPPPGIQRAQ